MQAGYREDIRSLKLEFFVVRDAKYGFWGEGDWLDLLVHFHSNVFCLDQWHPDGFLQEFKGAALGGSIFSLPFCDRDGGS